jgi:predicted anti-sigma-YlaC factor YlaD
MTTHYSIDHWMKYVKDELNETERVVLEDHLYTCDQCLELYIDAVDKQEEILPSISDEAAFMNDIMKKISNENMVIEKVTEKKRPFYQSSIFHYAIAASLTLILMSAGFFQSIIKHTDTIQKAEISVKQESKTDGLVDKTFAWMDSFDGSKKEDFKK